MGGRGILTSSLIINIAISWDCSAKSLVTDERAVYLWGEKWFRGQQQAGKARGMIWAAAHPSFKAIRVPSLCRTLAHDGSVRIGIERKRDKYPPSGLFILFNQIQCILKLPVPVPDHSHGCVTQVERLSNPSTHPDNRTIHGRRVVLASASTHPVDFLVAGRAQGHTLQKDTLQPRRPLPCLKIADVSL